MTPVGPLLKNFQECSGNSNEVAWAERYKNSRNGRSFFSRWHRCVVQLHCLWHMQLIWHGRNIVASKCKCTHHHEQLELQAISPLYQSQFRLYILWRLTFLSSSCRIWKLFSHTGFFRRRIERTFRDCAKCLTFFSAVDRSCFFFMTLKYKWMTIAWFRRTLYPNTWHAKCWDLS